MRSIWIAVFAVAAARSMCADSATTEVAVNDKSFHEALLKIAAEYTTYGRVDDETRWAPHLCRTPEPSTARISASKDAETHGSKLYFLFAKQRNVYRKLGDQTGQVIVKEGWTPKEVPADTPTKAVRSTSDGERDSYVPYAKKDGKLFHAESKHALFIMMKLDPNTPETDNGWVYGTVSPDGKNVTSAGRVSSCMACHQEAKGDRLFGISAVK
jgi:hypothetical protein